MNRLFFFLALLAPALSHGAFLDVPTTHPQHAAIDYVQSAGLVQGYPDGTFQPDQQINRVEFLKILLEAHPEITDECQFAAPPFTDVMADKWYTQYVYTAVCNTIVEGYPDGTFQPGSPINFAEATKVLLKTYQFENCETLSRATYPADAPWYTPYMICLDEYAARPTATIQPQDMLTRGEMAHMMYALAEQVPQATNFETPQTTDLLGLNQLRLETTAGAIVIELNPSIAPNNTQSVYTLASTGTYDGVLFHRVIKDFMIQTGDFENFNGTGGQAAGGGQLLDEISPKVSHTRGAVAMANSGPNTNGSQFYIVHQDSVFLDGNYTIIGRVISGMDVVDAIATVPTDARDKPLTDVKIISTSVGAWQQ